MKHSDSRLHRILHHAALSGQMAVLVLAILTIGMTVQSVRAQNAQTCPGTIEQAFSRALTTCQSATAADGTCFGAGNVVVEARVAASFFEQPGDRVRLDDIRLIRTVSAAPSWSTAFLKLHASFHRSQGRTTTMWLFGNTLFANNSRRAPELEVVTTATALLRSRPDQSSEVIRQVPVNTTLTANGRTTSGGWIRVFTPDLDAMSWVSSNSVSSGGLLLESVEDPEAGYARPFLFNFLSSGQDDAPCEGAPESGLLVQTADTRGQYPLVSNNTLMYISGTVFLQAKPGGTFNLNVIEGSVAVTTDLQNLDDATRFIAVPTGSRVLISLDEVGLASTQDLVPEPYDVTDFVGLHLNRLPRPISAVSEPLSIEQIATQSADAAIPVVPTSDTVIQAIPTVDATCRRAMRINDILYAGPGSFYEATGQLLSGAVVVPSMQALDPDGNTWWQIISGDWVKRESVRERGVCEAIPFADAEAPPPTNLVVLETCEAGNGPVRVGQQVTFRFTPPSFASLGDAMAAPGVDPGRIVVDGATQLQVRAEEPQRLTATAVSRSFSGDWTATEGTHRIIGERLSYSLVCDLTVPPG
ncbi:MAG: SH3 domain-containing protein [Chloroflexi bacterium]|nr:SH3 domain-containing protein [Chloroflexota bacterium]